jgi:hypothetical protein
MVATLGLVCCCYSLLALAESNTGWTFTEVVGGDLRTCAVRNDDDFYDTTTSRKQAGGSMFLPSFLTGSWSSSYVVANLILCSNLNF